jgi:hypothetical protein
LSFLGRSVSRWNRVRFELPQLLVSAPVNLPEPVNLPQLVHVAQTAHQHALASRIAHDEVRNRVGVGSRVVAGHHDVGVAQEMIGCGEAGDEPQTLDDGGTAFEYRGDATGVIHSLRILCEAFSESGPIAPIDATKIPFQDISRREIG